MTKELTMSKVERMLHMGLQTGSFKSWPDRRGH